MFKSVLILIINKNHYIKLKLTIILISYSS